MARQKGMLNLSGNLEPLAGAPLDSRSITPTVADLYIASNWPYKYIGMKTTVTATGDTYRLVNLDVTQESSWVNESSGGSGVSSLSDLEDVDLINPEEGETLIYDGEGGWTNGPAGQTYSDFTGATAQEAGAHGLVPAPTTGDISKFLKGDGTWATVPMPSFDFSNTSPEAMNFSTDEKVIGTWIDGKPLYQKTINCGALPNAGELLVDINVNNIEKVVGFNAICIDGVGQSIPIPNAICTNGEEVIYQINIFFNSSHKIRIVTGSNRTAYTGYVTLRYTKTTDSPVASGEKIVGQWIDGKPVYQKTFDNLSCTTNGDNWVELCRISNLDKIIDADLYTNNPFIKYIPHEITKKSGTTDEVDVCGNGSNRTIVYATIRYTKTF